MTDTVSHAVTGEVKERLRWRDTISKLEHLPVNVQSQIAILLKPLKFRTSSDNSALLSTLRETKFFKTRKLPDSTLQRLGAIAQYKSLDKGELVFEQGAEADFFYLILDGLVSIQIHNKNY